MDNETSFTLTNVEINYAEVEKLIAAQMVCILEHERTQQRLRREAKVTASSLHLPIQTLPFRDHHRETAAAALGIEAAKVSDSQRRAAKAINLGYGYGVPADMMEKLMGDMKKEGLS